MKQCPTCQEEFADKFGFCPVDGTPLGAPGVAPAAPAAQPEKVAKVHCGGVNTCKGQSGCMTEKNACAGQNGCKGQGWTETASADDCTKQNGTVVP